MNPKLSVIIPVYKVEAYLERCVGSVQNQNYNDLEIILVDDGSPDKCPQICDGLAKHDGRIVVVHKQNGGLSSARNAGLKVACGKYVCFLDSDDQWIEGRLNPIIQRMEQGDLDMLLFNAVALYPDGAIRKRNNGDFFSLPFKKMQKDEYYESIIEHGDFFEAAYTKIFNREFLLKQNLLFQQGIISEDIEWMFRVLRVAQNIGVSNVELYEYTYQRPGSITSTRSTRSLDDLMVIINQSICYCNENKHSCAELELEHCSYLLFTALGYLIDQRGGIRKEYKTKLKSYCFLFNYSRHGRTLRAKRIYQIFGYNLLAESMIIYMWLKRKNIVNRKNKINA